MARYKLTRPITSKGDADYWIIINKINNGVCFDQYTVRNKLFQYMTFQALKEAKLIDYKNGLYDITDLGKKYIEFYNIKTNRFLNFFTNTPIRKSKKVDNHISINSIYDLDYIDTSIINSTNISVVVNMFDGSSNTFNFSNPFEAINCSKSLFIASNVLNISISKGL